MNAREWLAAYDALQPEQKRVEKMFDDANVGEARYEDADTASFDLNEKYRDLAHVAADIFRPFIDRLGPEEVLPDPGTCNRHGGPWGFDETCGRCTYDDGTPRPLSDKGPLGPGAEDARPPLISGTGELQQVYSDEELGLTDPRDVANAESNRILAERKAQEG
jgi:hypothetical protein